MNLRNLSDMELVSHAEATSEDPVVRELAYRLARRCGHALAAETDQKLVVPGGRRTGLLVEVPRVRD